MLGATALVFLPWRLLFKTHARTAVNVGRIMGDSICAWIHRGPFKRSIFPPSGRLSPFHNLKFTGLTHNF
jgi:hypothetical protein